MVTQNHSEPVALKCPQCNGDLPLTTLDAIICPYCGSSLVLGRAQSTAPDGPNPPPADALVHGLRLKPLTCTDEQGTRLPLFRMLIPTGWQFQGGCRWQLDNPGMPAVVQFEVANPQGAEAFEVLPNMNFVWNNSPLSRVLSPTGSHYFGAEVRPPVSMADAFHSIILPRFRGAAQGLQIESITPLPELPRLVKSDAAITPGGSAEGGKARVRYNLHGQDFEEEFYGVVEVFRVPGGSLLNPSEFIVWFIDYLFSFRAAAGRLDATADLFTVMIQSFELNPEWYAAFKTIVQHLAQRQITHIRHIGEIGNILAEAGRQMREQNLSDWYRRQDIYDRLAVDRSRAIRDVDGFFDPHREEVVELPSGYGHAWANNLGEYILTEDSSFNPNLYSTQHWEPMQTQ